MRTVLTAALLLLPCWAYAQTYTMGFTTEVPGSNADALGQAGNVFGVAEFAWEVPLGEELVVTLGKLDPTAFFDADELANDECTQFLADMFVNTPALPWPDYT
ncbi:MAG TPA: hypothetical protein EYP17_06485 [Candidatus Latescibacteria bacterium]|nr:hypothetical protein [Candidatus Latescibacterota bacterium]